MLIKEKMEIEQTAVKKREDKAKRKRQFKEGSLTPNKRDKKEIRTKKRLETSARAKAKNKKHTNT